MTKIQQIMLEIFSTLYETVTIIMIANTKNLNENKQIWNQIQICRRAAGQPGAAVKCGHGCPLLPPWGRTSSLLEHSKGLVGWVWWVTGEWLVGQWIVGVISFQKKIPHKKWWNIVHLKTPNHPLSLGWKKEHSASSNIPKQLLLPKQIYPI